MSIQSPSGSPGLGSGGSHSRSTRNSGPKTGDPPRPAKNGFEWVWYPDGYWAERSTEHRKSSIELIQAQEREKPSLANRQNRIFKWGARPSKSPRELLERSIHRPNSQRSGSGISPLSDVQHPLWQLPKNLPQSPYLSEAEQVAALQQSVDPKSPASGPPIRDTWKSIDVGASIPLDEVVSPDTKATSVPGSGRFPWRPFYKHLVSFLFPYISRQEMG